MENNFEDINIIEQPKEIKVNLYHHQLASVYQMEKRECNQIFSYRNMQIETNIGVNADKTGYGKTLSMATLIFRDKMEWDMNFQYDLTYTKSFACGRIKQTITSSYEKINTTLILASQSIINQWSEEIEQKTPMSIKMITTKKCIDTVLVNNYDVILVTPNMYNRLVLKYHGFAWKRFIFDEPGHLKVPGMRKIIAGFIWLVTATPNAIIPKHKNCRNSFMYEIIESASWNDFTQFFDYLIVKNNDDFIDFSFSMPPTQHCYYKCYNPIYKTVKGFVTTKITEMISAGNISGAIKALGGGNTKNIAKLVREKKQEELDEIKSRIRVLTIHNKKKQIKILEDKIKRIEVQIEELDKRYTEILSGNCSICLEKITNPVMEPNCQNVFCGKCLLKWLDSNRTCPLCRSDVKNNQLIYIGEDNKTSYYTDSENKKILTKVDTVIEIIKSNPKGKFIISSSWNQSFIPIRNILYKNNIDFIEIKGNTNTRHKNIINYKKGNVKVVFLNSAFNGTGINFQETSDIIVYHDMPISSLNQIIGRANRLGRVEALKVHHLQI